MSLLGRFQPGITQESARKQLADVLEEHDPAFGPNWPRPQAEAMIARFSDREVRRLIRTYIDEHSRAFLQAFGELIREKQA